jgi:hypothetical protein
MSFNKFFALITLAVLILAGFASPAAINPDSTNANFALQGDVSSSTSVDAYDAETDANVLWQTIQTFTTSPASWLVVTKAN